MLVFVILHASCVDEHRGVQANPSNLLSNIEYIRGFYESRMDGQQQYWWTQFVSAVEYIKQLLNNPNA